MNVKLVEKNFENKMSKFLSHDTKYVGLQK